MSKPWNGNGLYRHMRPAPTNRVLSRWDQHQLWANKWAAITLSATSLSVVLHLMSCFKMQPWFIKPHFVYFLNLSNISKQQKDKIDLRPLTWERVTLESCRSSLSTSHTTRVTVAYIALKSSLPTVPLIGCCYTLTAAFNRSLPLVLAFTHLYSIFNLRLLLSIFLKYVF